MILVVDLEATCDENDALPADQMEIIEIGAVWASDQGIIHDEFQAFVNPVLHPRLTSFCTELTGIRQPTVDKAEHFQYVAVKFARFAQQYSIHRAVWASWGQYDFKQLQRDCERHGIANPLAHLQHINLKRQFAKNRRIKEVGMVKAMELAAQPLAGRHHRGIDDARNIAKLLPWCF